MGINPTNACKEELNCEGSQEPNGRILEVVLLILEIAEKRRQDSPYVCKKAMPHTPRASAVKGVTTTMVRGSDFNSSSSISSFIVRETHSNSFIRSTDPRKL